MHLIQKQHIEVTTTNRALAMKVQKDLQARYWGSVVDRLDQLFSEIADQDTIFRIERLEIDLGTIDLKEFEEQTITMLREKIMDIVGRTSLQQDRLVTTIAMDKQESTLIQRMEASDLEALLFFLTTGLLPWWYAKTRQASTIDELVEQVIQGEPSQLIHFLENANALELKRVVQQFKLKQLMNLAAKKETTTLARSIQVLYEALSVLEQKNGSSLALPIKKVLVKQLSRKENTISPNDLDGILKAIKRKLSETEFNQFIIRLKSKLTEVSFADGQDDKILQAIQTIGSDNLLKPIEKNDGQIEEAINQHASSTNSQTPSTTNNQSEEIDTTISEHILETQQLNVTDRHPSIQKQLEEGIFLTQVGWILTAPFLPMYFEQLGILNDDKKSFQSINEQSRAVLLTQYLATENTTIPEYQLLLNKIICGYPIAETIANQLEPTETELTQTNELLSAAIAHWGALGNSSIAALRETFFARDGKLIEQENNWQLIVERRSLDILMDRIPWSFKMIQFPWMDKRMVIEW